MSATIQVFLRNADLPTVADWNAAIKTHGFDLVLDPFDPRTDSAYRPAMLKGRESGFEWFLSPLAEAEPDSVPNKSQIGDCDLQADISFTSQADEDVTAAIAAAVLAAMARGYFRNTETDGRLLNAEEALAAARALVGEWQRRGPFNPDAKPAGQPPPVIAASVPPPIPTQNPPPVPTFILPPPAAKPGVRLFYRICCGFFVVVYLSFIAYSILITRGVVEPSLSVFTELATRDDPAAHAQALAEEKNNAFGVGVVSVFAVLFYAAAAFVPRKPWGWVVGLVAIITMIFPFCITIAFAIPLFIFWLKPETKRFFGKQF